MTSCLPDVVPSSLPAVRGSYRASADLSATTWFRVGGCAEILFKPADAEDLAHFIAHKSSDVPVTILGVGSNVVVRDGGIDGVVIRLGRGFTQMTLSPHPNPLPGEREAARSAAGDEVLTVGAGCLDTNVAEFAAQRHVQGLEFLSGIPGTIGGALAMNAGAYGAEIKDVLIMAQAVSPAGQLVWLDAHELEFSYRHCGLPHGWIFTAAVLRAPRGDEATIRTRMATIAAARESTQPTRERTGGSTFKNPTLPDGTTKKAWELIDAAGCRGMMIGAAQVSQLHCNFLINNGGATADEIERLGEEVREKVFANSGIRLEWEIKRIGKK